jgi:RimJ/RimL family protein N-acetyltransferase
MTPLPTRSPEIVPITLAHAAGFHACLDAVAREQAYLAQIVAPPLARIEDFVRENVAKDVVQFVALDAGQVVGWADVLTERAHALAHIGSLGMGLLPAYRGRGLGQQLLQACIHKAWGQGLTRIELAARADNTRAIRLYERMGFRHEGLKPRGLRFGGVYFDTVVMGLLRDERA